jgi:IS605 OrfB family transposase
MVVVCFGVFGVVLAVGSDGLLLWFCLGFPSVLSRLLFRLFYDGFSFFFCGFFGACMHAETSKIKKQLYFGQDIAEKQRRFFERRRKLQSYADKGSAKAEKYLRKLKRKQRDFVKNRSGEVAKQVVAVAKKYGASIAIEKLSIPGRKRGFSKKTNRKINLIPYGKLREFLSSNCEEDRVPLQVVDAYHTSKWCPHCGAVNNGHHPKNYALYTCKCGLAMNSDRKASLAVAVKSVLEWVTQDLTSPCFAQISNARVPVNGLVRSDADVAKVAVQHINLQWKATPFKEW